MFRHSRSFHVIFTLAVIVFGMPIYNVHGFQCKRAFKDESKAETEILELGVLRRVIFGSYQTRTEWNCAFDAKAVQKCSGSVFETDGFKCQCLVGKEGVEMSNENMTNLDPTTATYTPSTPTTASTYSVLSTQTAIARAVPVGVHISAV
ncbi:hypothetical protein GPALN_004182 [Globodera pallida]|nr:hypothetical protein GPALN_004182 [Globodera pallida]